MSIPKLVFIIPYRNRPQHKFFFSNYLKTIMEDRTDYEVYFSNQCDSRAFNRGATKNIGFLAIKNKYPNDYQNITFIFNDIDTIPFASIFNYETTNGIVKHFYGFEYALGGIVSITGHDFELTNGYPNFWGWGMEDTVLQKRCELIGLTIDRSQFYAIGSSEVLHLFDGVSRIINGKDSVRATNDNGIDGIKTIGKLNYSIDEQSINPLDNIYTTSIDGIYVINITSFITGVRFENDKYYKYDLREPQKNIINPNEKSILNQNELNSLNNNWSNIPYYPSADKKQKLVNQYGSQMTNNIIEYNLNNSNNPLEPSLPPSISMTIKENTQLTNVNVNNNNNQLNAHQTYLEQIRLYNESLRAKNLKQRIVPNNVNPYSPEYAKIIAAKPRATASVNIRMGGVY